MKNLKKVLALALVFAMTLTLFAGAAFTDQASIGVDYVDDVNMLVELGVLKGYENGEFRPENNVTRAEFAKMAYTLKYGADDKGLLFSGSASAFSDVEGVASVAWAKGYINYCANQKIIAGVGNGKFNPGGNVTVAEAAKMLLVILGCNPQTEGFVGANWQGNVVAKAIELGVFDGWSGDPTLPATRQLVAKLMRNTVFAPIYIYSPITGAGSQMQVLHPELPNPTLGEETMGLQHVTGIVVANENNAINTATDGAPFDENVTNWKPGDGYSAVDQYAETGKEQTIIAYEDEDDNGDFHWYELVLNDIALGDDMLGNLVDVYYTRETKSETSKINVIGDVLVNSKTVVYDVAANDIEIMPNKTEKKGSYRPYIKATVADGEEIIINAPAGTARENAATTDYNGKCFVDSNLFYSLNGTPTQLDAAGALVTSVNDAVVTNIGKPLPTSYRLVSTDGGKTISYIFSNPKYYHGVANYNAAKGTVSISGVASNLEVGEDVEIYEGLQKGDYVVATVADGKIILEPTETVTGSVSSYEKNTAVINGETYVGSTDILDGEANLAAWYNSPAKGALYLNNATYITYGNLLLKVDDEAEVAVSLDGYAVVLESSLDSYTDEPKVRLGLADGSSETYYVTYHKDGTSDIDIEEDGELAFQGTYANNALVGTIVAYGLRDGKAEITVQSNTDIVKNGTAGQIKDSAFTVSGAGKYFANAGSVMFLLYNQNANVGKVSFKTYKLDGLDNNTITNADIHVKGAGSTLVNKSVVTAMLTKKNGSDVMIGVMTAGWNGTPNVGSSDENVGLIIDSIYRYDVTNREKYLEVSMISLTEKAVLTGKFADLKSSDIPSGILSGDEVKGANVGFGIGAIVSYDHDGTEFTGLTKRADGLVSFQEAYNAGVDGFYKVTITDANSKRVSFHAYGAAQAAGAAAANTVNVHKYSGVSVIAAQDNEIVGEEIEEISKHDAISATDYNAIIEVRDGQIIRVLSLVGNIAL